MVQKVKEADYRARYMIGMKEELKNVVKKKRKVITKEVNADVKVAENCAQANSVKRQNFKEGERDICKCCHQWIPQGKQDKFTLCSSNTDDLWHLGHGFPLYFGLMRKLACLMFVMSIFFTGALVFQSFNIYYKLLEDNE